MQQHQMPSQNQDQPNSSADEWQSPEIPKNMEDMRLRIDLNSQDFQDKFAEAEIMAKKAPSMLSKSPKTVSRTAITTMFILTTQTVSTR